MCYSSVHANDLILVFLGGLDAKYPTHFAENYSLPTACKPLHVNQCKRKRKASLQGAGESSPVGQV